MAAPVEKIFQIEIAPVRLACAAFAFPCRFGIRPRAGVRKSGEWRLHTIPRAGHYRHDHHFLIGFFGNRNYLGQAIRILERDACRARLAIQYHDRKDARRRYDLDDARAYCFPDIDAHRL